MAGVRGGHGWRCRLDLLSSRLTPVAAEAGAYTVEDFRGRGYVGLAVSAWANRLLASGRVPIYSTSWDNAASQGVARKLGAAVRRGAVAAMSGVAVPMSQGVDTRGYSTLPQRRISVARDVVAGPRMPRLRLCMTRFPGRCSQDDTSFERRCRGGTWPEGARETQAIAPTSG